MLVLKRKEKQITTVINKKTNEVLRFRVYNIGNGQVDIAFEDAPGHFDIQRLERNKTFNNKNNGILQSR